MDPLYTPTDPVFKVGQEVVATLIDSGYQYELTSGKVYEVVGYIAPYRAENNFRFPAYVQVINDYGCVTTCHTYRFTPDQGEQ